MKIFTAIKSAILRSLKSWKGMLIVWFSSLLLVCTLAIPMRAVLNSGFGRSMITEKLAGGIDIEVFTDLGVTFKSLASFFTTGMLILILTCFILNAFVTGGLFNGLKGSTVEYSATEFFRASAKNFWSFLVISLIISLIIIVLVILVIVMPISLAADAKVPIEGAFFKTLKIVFPIFFVLLTLFLLVADYARAWQVSRESSACFKAIGFGFGRTFRSFLSSYPLMILLLLIQILYGWMVLTIISGLKPASGGGVFLLFLLSQILFFIKISLKVVRYGSVTSLMEA